MNHIYRVLLLLALSSTAAHADLPVCPVEPDGACPAIDVHFIDETLGECSRFQAWEDCFVDEELQVAAWFGCDAGAVNMRERCTDTCAWQTLDQVQTCDDLVAFLREQVC